MQQPAPRWRTSRLILIALPLCVLLGWFGVAALRAPPVPPTVPMTLAIPMQISASAFYVADARGLFARQGIEATLQPFLLGKQALQSMLDGKADLALVADTPFMLAVMRGEKISALATVFASRRSMAIYARRGSGIDGAASLAGKRIGTVPGTNAEFFLDNLLDMHRIERGSVTIVKLKADELVSAFRASKVDAVTVWNPDRARLEQEFGNAGTTILGEELFVYRFVLVGRQSYVSAHPDTVRRVLRALADSNRFIQADPDATRALLAKAVGLPAALLARSFDPSDFSLVLDQSLLLALSEQTRWAQQKQLTGAPMPNYLDYIAREPLRAIAPDADKIIR